jgi:nucleoside triphosphatase
MEQRFPEPTVGALILNRRGKLLLVRSHKWFDRLTIPGGHIELGETMEQAVKREVKEEVGLDVEVIDFILTQEAIFSPEFWKRRHYIFFDFLCRCRNDTVIVDGAEIQDYLWVEPTKAQTMNLDSFVRRSIKEYLRKRRSA